MPHHLFSIKYPQNYIIRRPLAGAGILFGFSFVFMLMYHPLDSHASFYFGFEGTMLVYTLASSVFAGVFIQLLKRAPVFSRAENWTLGKEILALYIVLQSMGVVVYLLAFAVEPPGVETRWNLATFWDSCKNVFLVYIIPFVFFSASNYKFLFMNFESTVSKFQEEQQALVVNIRSKLKKEMLSFQADELLYAVSEGNYVVFHLFRDAEIRKVTIRNSISEIETQLSGIPYYFRCHRGFIVNLHKVASQKGNASGYLLKLKHSGDTVPVSRKNTQAFRQLMSQSRP